MLYSFPKYENPDLKSLQCETTWFNSYLFHCKFLFTNSKDNIDIKGIVMQIEKLLLLFVPGITQGNREHGVIPRFCPFAFVFGINQEN